MRFSAAHSFDEDGAWLAAHLSGGGPSGHPDTQPLLVWTCQGLDQQRSSVGGHAGGPGRDLRPGPPPCPCAYRNELISMVSVRPGPTPIAEIGAPDISSSAFTYACAFFGRSAKVFALVMSSDQPGSIS